MGNSWKDLFTFSRKEQGGVAVLLAILMALIILHPLIPYLTPANEEDLEDFRREAEELIAEMERLDSAAQTVQKPKYPEKIKEEPSGLSDFLKAPFPFDPNTADEKTLKKTGLERFAMENIIRYREKGGKFKSRDDILKIYGMDEQWYDSIFQFIQIVEDKIENEDPAFEAGTQEKDSIDDPLLKETKKILIELNTADSAALTLLHGIGPSFAKRILAYRTLLGGYYDGLQLLEVYGMDTLRYAGFREQITVDPELIVKMDLNTVGFKEMLKHLYFEYYLVKIILNERENRGKFDSVGELLQIPEIYPELYEKISPYLYIGGRKEK